MLQNIRCRPIARLCLPLLLGMGVAVVAPARTRADALPFEIIEPDHVAFNYPDPPREGRPDYFTIAEDGEARCVIVIAAEPDEGVEDAARHFGRYLELATGAAFRVLPDDAPMPEGMGQIHIGRTAVSTHVALDLPELRYGEHTLPNVHGYLIKTLDPNTLVIRGAELQREQRWWFHPPSVSYGLIGFLRRYAGIEQYWSVRPGQIGEVIPEQPTLRVPEIEWRDWPYFVSRQMDLAHLLTGGGYRLDFFRLGDTLPPGENYYELLPPARYGQTHPEYFPLGPNGERRVPAPDARIQWQPCVSNPEVANIMATEVIAYFERYPDALGLNVAINDGHGDCECSPCRAMDAPDTDYGRRTLTDRYIRFTNRVAEIVSEIYPDKLISFLGYSGTRYPPRAVDPHPNMVVTMVSAGQIWENWDRWYRQTRIPHMGIYLHRNDMINTVLPMMNARQMARQIRYIIASGRARMFYMETQALWPFSGVVVYVTAQLLWDPRQDVDELIHRYYHGLFGPAGDEMLAFHEILENGFERLHGERGRPHPFACVLGVDRTPAQFALLTPEEAGRAAATLDRAAATDDLNADQAHRIALVQAIFDLQHMGVRRYWADVRMGDPVASMDDVHRVIDDARTSADLARAMGEHIRNVLEQEPFDRYLLFQRLKSPGMTYTDLRSGTFWPESRMAIAGGFGAVATFLYRELGPEEAAAWLRRVREQEENAELIAALEAAEIRASGVELTNLLEDGGFEQLGERLAPDDRDLAPFSSVELDVEPGEGVSAVVSGVGLRVWYPDRTPFNASVTWQDAHSGEYSLRLEHIDRGRLSYHVLSEPNTRYRIRLAIKHNDAPGRYRLEASVRPHRGQPIKSLARVQVPELPDQWQHLVIDITTPEEAWLLNLDLYIDDQTASSRIWVDDVFIGAYPK